MPSTTIGSTHLASGSPVDLTKVQHCAVVQTYDGRRLLVVGTPLAILPQSIDAGHIYDHI